jgi:4Fe-4S ferredoxin
MCSPVCPVDALEFKIDDKSIKEMEEYPKLIKSSEISDEECIYCKACETACPRDAITIARVLPDRSKLVTGEIEIDKETCVSCGICEEMCPADAITMEHHEPTSAEPTVSTDINVDKEKCVYCLICKKSCPVDAIKAVCRSCSYGEYDLNPEDTEIKGSSFIDEETCVDCGWCEEICPVDAAHVEKAFEGELLIDQEKCEACGACLEICPCNVLSFPKEEFGKQGAENVRAEEKYCIYCGACEKACPVEAIEVKRTAVKHTPTKSKSWDKKMESLKT